jgi:vacuolar iron transporter family protein
MIKYDFVNGHYIPHADKAGTKLNWLRAAVLGANDGIVSIAGLVVGVAGATGSRGLIITAGVAGIVAGALSMAVGEYVSVSSQRDSERALLEKERQALADHPEHELQELAYIYYKKGLKKETALTVAKELSAKDAFAAHVDAELGIDPDNLTNPGHAALASALAFLAGAIIPLVAIILPSESYRIPVAFGSVVLALIITGVLSAAAGGASKLTATLRIVAGGVLAMAITYAVGKLIGFSHL